MLSLLIGFVAGILLSSSVAVSWPFVLLFLLFTITFLVLYFLSQRQARLYLLVGLGCLGFVFGAGRMLLTRPTTDFSDSLGQTVTLTGTIVAEPSPGETTTQIIFAPNDSDSNILLLTARYPEYHYGDTIEVKGKLAQPQNFTTQAGTVFDYQNYLAKDNIYYEIFRPQIVLKQSVGTFRGALYNIKQKFLTSFTRVLPEPEAALLGGITIGSKQGLDKGTTDLFRTVGLSHVIVLSGYNITIVAETVMQVLARVPIFYGAALGAFSIILFVLMTGASSTALRAAIMALVALLGRVTGRQYDSLRALWVAAVLMLIINPRLLVFDISFQLSFLATLGVIIGPPVLERYLERVPEKFGLRETVATTASAQLLVLPWIVYKMGQLSLVGLPVNILVLPFVPLTMFLGSILGIVGLVSYSLSLPFAYVTYLPLAYMLTLANIFAAVPFAALFISQVPLVIIILVYLGLAILYRWARLKNTGG